MTSYNYENFIAKAIESVINQTISDWELIIIDDGSKDNSINIINEYIKKDTRIKLFTHTENKNKGLKESVLLGLKKAENEWIAFLESDDYLAPNYLEEKYKFIEKYPEAKFVYNDVKLFGDETQIEKKSQYFLKLKKLWENKEFQNVFDNFGFINVVPTFSCVMIKKDELLKLNFDCPSIPNLDYWLWWQFAEKNNLYFINQKLTNWQLHKESYLNSLQKTIKTHIKRSFFIPNIIKLFETKPKLCGINKLEQFSLFAIFIHTFIYLKRNGPKFIKKLFITS